MPAFFDRMINVYMKKLGDFCLPRPIIRNMVNHIFGLNYILGNVVQILLIMLYCITSRPDICVLIKKNMTNDLQTIHALLFHHSIFI